MPRLELIASHMAANLMENVRSALKRYPVAECFGWSDSTVVLHWVRESASYKPFVSNRVDKVKKKNYIVWTHVPSEQNPADCGSRGCSFTKLDSLWWDGPSWLLEKENWPIDIITTPSVESESEAKRIKEVLAVAINKKEDSTFQPLLAKYELRKVIRMSSWILRFITNCRQGGVHGPLTTEEVNQSKRLLIKVIQEEFEDSEDFTEDKLRLNLQKNADGLFECRGRIQGHYPLYLPQKSLLAEKIVMKAHKRTLRGQLTKRIRHKCHGCKIHRAIAFAEPPTGLIPKDRVAGTKAFEVTGVDYAEPLICQIRQLKDLSEV
ncbi:uncharacterized protein LOC130636887 [Hydractinia symbiolongicarpus]|uniref:uncharacterized protein LOC130636887 n=1 Tax=Hydractinia symbiolongicarpus TaxID=13093 RepID=UPI00254A96FA|nr:uncharacterized protein LOC130636887 [Hydractinia symbiolongicarpus]